MSTLALVQPLSAGIDADSVLAGFALGLTVGLVSWGALVGLSIVRRLLSE